MMRIVVPVLSLALATAGCAGSVESPGTSEETSVGLFPSKNLRIAIVGAGPSGITAADTLRSEGYQKITIFEKNSYVGGKVTSLHNGT